MPTAAAKLQLIGLRLGWSDSPKTAEAVMQLLRAPAVAGAPAPAQAPPAALHVSLLPLPPPRGAIGTTALRPTHADALLWHSDAPEAQFTQLQRLGLSPACQLSEQGAAFARLEARESGACTMEWHGTPPMPCLAEGAIHISSERLQGLELRVPAPERTAAHWATLLNTPLGRDTDGAPLLHCAPLHLRFAPLRGGSLPGVGALLLSANAATELNALAHREGWTRANPTRWWVGGVQLSEMKGTETGHIPR